MYHHWQFQEALTLQFVDIIYEDTDNKYDIVFNFTWHNCWVVIFIDIMILEVRKTQWKCKFLKVSWHAEYENIHETKIIVHVCLSTWILSKLVQCWQVHSPLLINQFFPMLTFLKLMRYFYKWSVVITRPPTYEHFRRYEILVKENQTFGLFNNCVYIIYLQSISTKGKNHCP